jgi:hypothetical protein
VAALNSIEREVVVLAVAIEAINDIVNHEMLRLPNGGPDAEARFKSLASAALFAVRLADMLEKVDSALLGIDGSLLAAVQAVSAQPLLAPASAAVSFGKAARELSDWLETEVEIEVWFPSLDKNPRLKLRRREFVSICGNISKHTVTRLTGKARQLQAVLERNGVIVTEAEALGALDDFYEKFHTDVLSYHSTTISELLNNLRWAIHEYLEPEFKRAYIVPKAGDLKYGFDVPAAVQNTFANSRYWDIMNSVRGGPWIPKFTGARHLKGRF